ncbi:hypothetical protein [Paraburkholderia tagetis]|uniref:Uncharacterized protein n=1 Tax=Paraburkholderia tagetis TaxID=2913261 RepID=A0A9X1UKY2_9BURK|nr:hypothetical protein [Paraburkholderia tagetis]MCG5076511.1 hypothetical protein [Paraburkholderia tagetis]
MNCFSMGLFDVYVDVFVINRGFGRPPGESEIFGFWGEIVPGGGKRTFLGAHHFRSVEKEGYPDRKQAIDRGRKHAEGLFRSCERYLPG